MKGPKWLILFISALLLTFAVWGSINIAVDPFGVFGDLLLRWDAYTQTLNPRVGKVSYLTEHWDDYDSYIIGSSSAASYLPQTLADYTEGHWYNLFHYGADIAYDEQLVKWLIANDDVSEIILVLGLSEADSVFAVEDLTDRTPLSVTGGSPLAYYGDFLFASPSYALEKLTSHGKDTNMPQAFDVFLPESGTYDKRLRDAESIGALEDYLTKNGGDYYHITEQGHLRRVDACVETVKRIRNLCDEAGVALTVILSPVYEGQLTGVTDESLNAYFKGLGDVTDYWNFSISPISYDPRYFYDTTHTRNATANMVLAQVYGDKEAYIPEGFGVFWEKNTAVTAQTMRSESRKLHDGTTTVTLPILLYHHIDETAEKSGTTLHPDTFEEHMTLLRDNGYTTVTLADVAAYVERGTPLPEKPVLVTFDDGYESNYRYAYPILRDNGQKAAIFVIGTSVGHTETYKDTAHPITPHFGETEMGEMTESGYIDIQSHTFDMHQWAPYETGDKIRENILPLHNESEGDYMAALTADIALQHALFASNDLPAPTALAFPSGQWTDLANVVLMSEGYKITLTTDATRANTLVQGLPQSLINLGRMNVSGDTTAEEILRYCGGNDGGPF